MEKITKCRLAELPDLNHENEYVESELLRWVKLLVGEYKIDGLRIDTVPEVPRGFWEKFSEAAGVYTVGEVFLPDWEFVGSYVGAVDGVLNYPLWQTMRNTFMYSMNMQRFSYYRQHFRAIVGDLRFMGNFNDNHDNARFLNHQVGIIDADRGWFTAEQKMRMCKSILAMTLLSEGIPIIYYGSEQAFDGGSDPQNREVLWKSGYNTQSELYQYIRNINQAR